MKFEKSLNATLITLIPKKAKSVEVKYFSPISFVNGVYKIISKVLANRISTIMDKIILKPQNAFVKGRQILDLRWHNWMKYCITTARFSVLVNGTLEGFFNSSHGLRQGDLLSPILLVLVMDVLSRMIKADGDESFLSEFSVGGTSSQSVNVSHLLFIDDTVIFCEPDPNQIRSLIALLFCLEATSSLKVNLSKSKLVLVGLVNHIRDLAKILKCKMSSLPMKYLGHSLGAFHKSKVIWDGMIGGREKIPFD
ncbi:hypothetical protein F2P56_003792 [Juglans regia]|uniref:Uncharacterized protein LOC108990955 n=2 Tax=Juglans regia TaxID=51240 RepID=A0A2I4EMK1_JUGRE|nr:uncharacterized protein LOC108990955 [Juglans regia]KAF5477120.1 hypothetical protein F2P56_003792 [Juglans regia]